MRSTEVEASQQAISELTQRKAILAAIPAIPASILVPDNATEDDPNDPEVEAWLRLLPPDQESATRKHPARLEQLFRER